MFLRNCNYNFCLFFRQLQLLRYLLVVIVSVGAGRGVAEAAGAGERGRAQLSADPRHQAHRSSPPPLIAFLCRDVNLNRIRLDQAHFPGSGIICSGCRQK